MSPTRRTILRFSAAVFVSRALPAGARPVAALAAKNEISDVEVIDSVDAAPEIVGREKWHLFAFGENPGNQRCAVIFVERFRDGSAQFVFEAPIAPDVGSPTYRENATADARRFVPNPRRVLDVMLIPAPTFADLDAAISLVNRLD